MLFTPSPVRPGSSSGTVSLTDGPEPDIENRLSIVERAIRLQMALGATHLQQIEKDPAAFGVPTNARSSVRQLRRERNRALHCVEPKFSDLKARHSDFAAAKKFHGTAQVDHRVNNANPGDYDGLNTKVLDDAMHHQRGHTNPGISDGLNVSNTKARASKARTSPTSTASGSSGDEDPEELPSEEMFDDPLYLADVFCGLATGAVVSIARDTVTNEKLYRVLFDDGGFQHFTHEEAHTKLRVYDWCALHGIIDSTDSAG